jgi:hypothetical protein
LPGLQIHEEGRAHEPQSIRDAVHSELKRSQSIYDNADAIARHKAFSSRHRQPARRPAVHPSLSASTCW